MWANVHIPPPLKHCRLEMLIASLCAFYAEDSFCQENRNWRNSHFLVYEIDFSFSVLTFFVNCAFLAVTDYAIATMHFTVSLKNFALCGERRGTLSPRPLPPFKKRGRKLCFLEFLNFAFFHFLTILLYMVFYFVKTLAFNFKICYNYLDLSYIIFYRKE